MAEEENPFDRDDDPQAELKQKLVRRVVVAGVLAVVLLGGLAIFDTVLKSIDVPSVPPRGAAPAPRSELAPVPVPAAGEAENETPAATGPVEPAIAEAAPPVAEPIAEAVSPVAEMATAPPLASKALPAGTMPPRKVDSEAAQTLRVLAERQPDLRQDATTDQAVAEGSGAPEAPPPPPEVAAFPSEPAAPIAEATSPPRSLSRRTPPPTRLGHGYIVQAGVFKDARRAQELHGRLVRAGVAATLETRVQVGPFLTRQEADAARATLRAMGIESLLLPPRQ